MKKLVPIISAIFSAIVLILSIATITIISKTDFDGNSAALALIAVPMSIVSLVVSALSSILTAPFISKSRICKIAFALDIAATLLSIITVAIWQVA